MSKLITQLEFAKFKGVTKQAVNYAIKNGRLIESLVMEGQNTLIDLDKGMAEWDQNTRPPLNKTRSLSNAEKYNEARTIKEAYNAKLAKLEFEEKSKLLVEAELVKKQAFELARTVRNAIMAIPDRISGELAAETDQHDVFLILTKELTEALESLSNEI